MKKDCRCGSTLDYAECCELLHLNKKQASTALELMRARYTAYTLKNADYLLASWAVLTRPNTIDFSNEDTEWTRLEIVSSKKGSVKDSKGIVEFKAYFTESSEKRVMTEISRFVKKQNQWFYLDGKVKSISAESGSFNQGLNAPCACGSGKKFKRCCKK